MSKRNKIGLVVGVIVSVLILVIRLFQHHSTKGILNLILFALMIGAFCGFFVIYFITLSDKEKFIKEFKEKESTK